MGARWKTVAKEAGYDPDKTKDAPLSGGKWRAYIEMVDMKNAQIGNPTECSGAKCIVRAMPADWAYVGVSSAFVVPTNSKTILRYLVNGVANRQDRTMSVLGEEVILRPPPAKEQLGAKKKDRAKVRAKTEGGSVTLTSGPKKKKDGKPRQPSIARLLRESA